MLGYVLAKGDALTHVDTVDTVDLVAITFAQLGKAGPAHRRGGSMTLDEAVDCARGLIDV